MIAWQSHRDLDSGTTAAPHVSVSASHFDLREPRSVRVCQITLRFRNAALQRSNARHSTRRFESDGQYCWPFCNDIIGIEFVELCHASKRRATGDRREAQFIFGGVVEITKSPSTHLDDPLIRWGHSRLSDCPGMSGHTSASRSDRSKTISWN
jgi:hypothetical protein